VLPTLLVEPPGRAALVGRVPRLAFLESVRLTHE
jgi:hypothetical protein